MRPEQTRLIEARDEVRRRLRQLLVEQLHIRREPDEIDPDCPLFATGLGLDSVDAVELVVALESEFGVILPDGPTARRHLRTLNTLAEFILSPQPVDVDAQRSSPGGRGEGEGVDDWALPHPRFARPLPLGEGVGSLALADGSGTEILALRTGVAWSRQAHVVHLRLRGEPTFALLDRVVAADLLLRDSQVLQSLILRDDGSPLADVYVARSDEDFYLLSEGPPAADLLALLRAHAPPGAAPAIEVLDDTHEAIALHGPYAWELLAELLGPEVIGMPYGSLFHVGGWLVMRIGKTGEFGYELLVPRAGAEAARARLLDAGARFDLVEVGLDTLDQCALENWFFDIRREGRSPDVTPLELQLQWRVSWRKDALGSAALRARRAAGIARRLTTVLGPSPLAAGDRVRAGEREVGALVNAGFCRPRREWVALALLDVDHAHAGLDGLTAEGAAGASPLRTVSPPVLSNRSLFVSPQRHAWATRATDALPALVER